MAIKAEMKYCAFIDVLGYKNLVTSDKLSTDQKVVFLEDIYQNLFTTSFAIKQLKRFTEEGLFIKSFSDCYYLEADNIKLLLYAVYTIHNLTFGYYGAMPAPVKKYRPLLRSGVVRDWVTRVMDIGSLARQQPDEMAGKEEFQNPVGLGVARAYLTAEKSKLSGMRIIISAEIMQVLPTKKFESVAFTCFYLDCADYMTDQVTRTDTRLFLIPINVNECQEPVDQYELCWPVFHYSYNNKASDIDNHIRELWNRAWQFDDTSKRHLTQTAVLMDKSWQITLAIHPELYSKEEQETYSHMIQSLL